MINLENLEDRLVPATFFWNPGQFSAELWASPENWRTGSLNGAVATVAPGANDDVNFTVNRNCVVDNGNFTVNRLVFDSNTMLDIGDATLKVQKANSTNGFIFQEGTIRFINTSGVLQLIGLDTCTMQGPARFIGDKGYVQIVDGTNFEVSCLISIDAFTHVQVGNGSPATSRLTFIYGGDFNLGNYGDLDVYNNGMIKFDQTGAYHTVRILTSNSNINTLNNEGAIRQDKVDTESMICMPIDNDGEIGLWAGTLFVNDYNACYSVVQNAATSLTQIGTGAYLRLVHGFHQEAGEFLVFNKSGSTAYTEGDFNIESGIVALGLAVPNNVTCSWDLTGNSGGSVAFGDNCTLYMRIDGNWMSMDSILADNISLDGDLRLKEINTVRSNQKIDLLFSRNQFTGWFDNMYIDWSDNNNLSDKYDIDVWYSSLPQEYIFSVTRKSDLPPPPPPPPMDPPPPPPPPLNPPPMP